MKTANQLFRIGLVAVAVLVATGLYHAADRAQAATNLTATLSEWKIALSPTDVLAGDITIAAKNQGAVEHELVLLKTDVAADKLEMAGNRVNEDKYKSAGEIADFSPGKTESQTFKLDPGKYVLICNITGHYQQGMAAALTVNPVPPATTATLSEWTIAMSPAEVKAGDVTVVARNAGAVSHELVLLKTDVAPDKLEMAGNRVNEDKYESMGEIADFDPATTESATFKLDAGKYVLICNITGHYQQGMRAALVVAQAGTAASTPTATPTTSPTTAPPPSPTRTLSPAPTAVPTVAPTVAPPIAPPNTGSGLVQAPESASSYPVAPMWLFAGLVAVAGSGGLWFAGRRSRR
jgi:uncharacterized cupredoxin-like copper-binding protein